MDPIYETKFNNPDYESHFQNGDYQNNSTLTGLEAKFMISILLLSSCFMPIMYCLKSCEINNIFRIKKIYLNEILIKNNLSDNCSICLENYKKNDKCVKLNCNHIFHKKCIHDWFKNQISKSENLNCPLCRNNLF